MVAARALGLDCGPMSGFDADKVNAEFFPDGKWRANFLCNLGFGDTEKLHPRAPARVRGSVPRPLIHDLRTSGAAAAQRAGRPAGFGRRVDNVLIARRP